MSRLFQHGRVDSTNERALEAIGRGEARHGDVHVAQEQTAGRGRRGATWESPPDAGLYVSIVLFPPPPTPEPAGLTIAAGLALWDAVRELGVSRARLKWPNDLLVGDAKLAGILVEARSFDPAHPSFVVGTGINVSQRDFPAALTQQRQVTSLALEGCVSDKDDVLRSLVARTHRRLEQLTLDPHALAQAFLSATELEGRRIRVRIGSQEHEGLLAGIDIPRGLRLETNGRRQVFALAQVTAVEAL